MDDLLGEIRIFANSYLPKEWMPCNGQILSIQSNTALFSILGTTYGGNGSTTFALPNLQNRSVLGAAVKDQTGTETGPGLSPRRLGESTDVAGSFTLTLENMPPHTHTLYGVDDTTATPIAAPTNAYLGSFPSKGLASKKRYNNSGSPNGKMAVETLSKAGVDNPAPVTFEQPSLALSYGICVQGVWPQRPE